LIAISTGKFGSFRGHALAVAALGALTLSSVVMAAAPTKTVTGVAVKAQSQSLAPVLYDQNDNDSGNAISSQNFESAYDVYDNMGADDFVVPAGQKWIVSEVDVTGQYTLGPAASVHITFYKNKKNLPQNVVADYPAVKCADTAGSFVCNLGKTKAKLKPGKYWVSVQVNMDFAVGGQWYWQVRSLQAGSEGAWQNPGDGFGTGCTTWGGLGACIGNGPDLMFTLRGKSKPYP
jgi:hypothetical protein